MRREEMVLNVAEWMIESSAESLLKRLENAGMRPPDIKDLDKLQALHSVYINPTINIWDEDFEKDLKVSEAYAKRMKRKQAK